MKSVFRRDLFLVPSVVISRASNQYLKWVRGEPVTLD